MRFNDFHKDVCVLLGFGLTDQRGREVRTECLRQYAQGVLVNECAEVIAKKRAAAAEQERVEARARGLEV
jgi:hypothetical protein